MQLIRWTLEWEKSRSTQIHKGTPFFFLGESLIYQGDIETAFLFIYNAMEEDKSSYQAVGQPDRCKQAPAYMTTTIVDNHANVLYETVVRRVREEISNYVTSFSRATNSSYTLADFQACFLGNPDLEIEKLVFFFVYNMYVHIQRNRFQQVPQFFNNDFTKIKNLDSIFNMCLIIEESLQHRFGKTGTDYFISDGVLDLAAAKAWITAGKTREETEKQADASRDHDSRCLVLLQRSLYLSYLGRGCWGWTCRGGKLAEIPSSSRTSLPTFSMLPRRS